MLWEVSFNDHVLLFLFFLYNRVLKNILVITGKDRDSIIAAKTKLQTIIELNRSEQPADHFLAVPLACHQLTESFEVFKKEVLKIDVSITQFGIIFCHLRRVL